MKILKKSLAVSLVMAMIISTTNITRVFADQPTMTIVTQPLWDDIADISDGLIKVQNGIHDEYNYEGIVYKGFNATDGGFIDENGKEALKIKNHYEYLDEYFKNDPTRDSYAKSINDGEIKASGFSIEEIRDFHQGRAYIMVSQQYSVVNNPEDPLELNMARSETLEGFIDKNNKLVIETYDNIEKNKMNLSLSGEEYPGDYKEGISTMWASQEVGDDYKNGLHFWDLNGKPVGASYIDQADFVCFNDTFGEGLLGIGQGQMDEKTQSVHPTSMGYVDKSGKTVINTSKFKSTNPFKDGLALVEDKNGLKGIINKTGDYVIQPQFTNAVRNNSYDSQIFFEDRGSFEKNGKWGIIDKTGKIISDFIWDAAGNYSNGLCVVKKDGKFGYVDFEGRVVITPQFDEGNAFVNGMALVKSNNIYKLIDKTGKQVGTQTWDFDKMESMSGTGRPDLIRYEKNNKWGLAKITGQVSDAISDTTKNQSLYNMYWATAGRDEHGNIKDKVYYAFKNNGNKTDEINCAYIYITVEEGYGTGTKPLLTELDFSGILDMHIIFFPQISLKPGEIYESHYYSTLDSELMMMNPAYAMYRVSFDSSDDRNDFYNKIPHSKASNTSGKQYELPLDEGKLWLKSLSN